MQAPRLFNLWGRVHYDEVVQAMMRSPRIDPLLYPGELVDGHCIVMPSGLVPVRARGQRLSRWEANYGGHHTLDGVLTGHGFAPLSERTPILGVGSLGCPQNLRHLAQQFRFGLGLPVLWSTVVGVRVVYAATLASRGYVPWTVVHDPESVEELPLLMVDDHQLQELDAADHGFKRVLVTDSPFVSVETEGIRIPFSYGQVYAGGALLDSPRGNPVGVVHVRQEQALELVAAASAELSEVLGVTAQAVSGSARRSSWNDVRRTRDAIIDAGYASGSDPLVDMPCHKGLRPRQLGASSREVPCGWHG